MAKLSLMLGGAASSQASTPCLLAVRKVRFFVLQATKSWAWRPGNEAIGWRGSTWERGYSLKSSKLERTYVAYLLFSRLQEGQHHVKVKINDWSEVNVLMDFNPTNLSGTQVPVDRLG